MPGEELQRQRETTTFAAQQQEEQILAQEVPQQVQQQQQEQLPEEFEQPQIQGVAPAPELVQPVQQQQLSRKERRNLEHRQQVEEKARLKAEREEEKARLKAERKKAKKMAAAKLQMDRIEKRMRRNPIQGNPATDYESVRPEESYAAKTSDLERLILTHVTDEERCRELLNGLQQYKQEAEAYDRKCHDMEFRQQCLPLYVEQVMQKDFTEAMGQQLARERVDFFLSGAESRMEELYRSYENLILQDMSPEQQQEAKERNQAGKEVYEQEIAQRMEQGHITREEAQKQRAEEIIRSRRPLTLQKLEEVREEHLHSEEFYKNETRGFENIRFLNYEIRKQFPKDPKVTWEDMDKMVTPYLKEAMTNLSYQMRVPNCKIMNLILDSGRFKTQMETLNTSGGRLLVKKRKEITNKFFGVDTDTLPAEKYEIYGYGSHGDLVKESKEDSMVGQGVGQYGQIVVKLKKSAMKGRVTMTLGDSLDSSNGTRPAFVDKPDFHAVSVTARCRMGMDVYKHNKKVQNGEKDPVDLERALNYAAVGYLELQYHDGLRVEDIESVTLLADYKPLDKGVQTETEMPPELVARLKKLGIRATIVKDGKEHEL